MPSFQSTEGMQMLVREGGGFTESRVYQHTHCSLAIEIYDVTAVCKPTEDLVLEKSPNADGNNVNSRHSEADMPATHAKTDAPKIRRSKPKTPHCQRSTYTLHHRSHGNCDARYLGTTRRPRLRYQRRTRPSLRFCPCVLFYSVVQSLIFAM